MAEIELTHGKIALIDDEDYEWLNQWRWQYHEGYAVRSEYLGKTGEKDYYYQKKIFMHKFIIGANNDEPVDHRDRNELNNTRNNLRKCTTQQNNFNRSGASGSLSSYKGVTVRDGKYIARIRKDGKLYHLGVFDSETACANCYNYFAQQMFGEFAFLNDVEPMDIEEWSSHKKQITTTSDYVGVSLDKRTGKYESYLWVGKKKYFLGYYSDEENAVIARNNKIKELGLDKSKIQEVMWDAKTTN